MHAGTLVSRKCRAQCLHYDYDPTDLPLPKDETRGEEETQRTLDSLESPLSMLVSLKATSAD